MQLLKRQTAIKARIGDLLRGQFVKDSGELPNHVLLSDGRKIGRANVLGTVVEGDTSLGYPFVILDDGTGKITVRAFEPLPALTRCEVGNIVCVIGRLREFNKELYLIPEIVRMLHDKTWILVRQAELEGDVATVVLTGAESAKEQLVEELVEEEHPLLKVIRALDTGEGADYERVVAESGHERTDDELQHLLNKGQIFLAKPGRLKVLN